MSPYSINVPLILSIMFDVCVGWSDAQFYTRKHHISKVCSVVLT